MAFLHPKVGRAAIRDRNELIMTSPKQQLQASLTNIDRSITATLHSRLSTIQPNDTNLTKQTKSLQSRTHEARKQQDNWNNLVRVGRNGMKVLKHTSKNDF